MKGMLHAQTLMCTLCVGSTLPAWIFYYKLTFPVLINSCYFYKNQNVTRRYIYIYT